MDITLAISHIGVILEGMGFSLQANQKTDERETGKI